MPLPQLCGVLWGVVGSGPCPGAPRLEVEEGDQLCPPSDPQTRPSWAISGDPHGPWWAQGARWAQPQVPSPPAVPL